MTSAERILEMLGQECLRKGVGERIKDLQREISELESFRESLNGGETPTKRAAKKVGSTPRVSDDELEAALKNILRPGAKSLEEIQKEVKEHLKAGPGFHNTVRRVVNTSELFIEEDGKWRLKAPVTAPVETKPKTTAATTEEQHRAAVTPSSRSELRQVPAKPAVPPRAEVRT